MKCWNYENDELLIANCELPRSAAGIAARLRPPIRNSQLVIRNSRPRVILKLVAALVATMATLTRADDPRAARMTPITRVFQQASPAVVNISSTTIVTYR